MSFLKRQKWWQVHPLLLAGYPVLALLAANVDQVDPTAALRPALLSVLVAAIIYGLLSLASKDTRKGALVLSLGLILFYTYGHLYNYLELNPIFGFQLGRHRYLIPLWGMLAAGGVWAVIRAKQISPTVTQAVTLSAAVMLVFPGLQIANYYVSYTRASRQDRLSTFQAALDQASLDELPDVYFIVLDMYARQDVLAEVFAFDNQDFIDQLRDLDFYVADCSLSNYGKTRLSLASQLNLETIQTLMGENAGTETELYVPLIKHSFVRQQLEGLGYQTIAFETGWPFTEIKDAGLYFAPPTTQSGGVINPFEAMLLDTTALLPLADLFTIRQMSLTPHYAHYIRENFVLDKLSELPVLPGRKFVFAHIIIPHQPYVFLPDGSMQTDTDFYSKGWGIPAESELNVVGYRNQVAFVNSRMIPLLDTIIQQSENPPVILLFSDHGAYPYRNANLAAYYLPGNHTERLYPTITSVNSFRLVFNLYFGGRFEMLPDVSYEIDDEGAYYFFSEYQDSQACQP